MDSIEFFSNSFDDNANEEHAQNISIKSMQENVSSLEKLVNELKIEVQILKTHKNELDDELTDYRQKLFDKDVQYKEMVQKLNTKQNVIEELKSELFEEARKSEATLAAKNEKDREIITSKTENKGLQDQNTELLEKVFRLQDELDNMSQKKLTFENDCKQLRAQNEEFKTSLKTIIHEKKLIEIETSELQMVCDQQRLQIDNLRPPFNMSVESDASLSHHTLFMSAYDIMEDSPRPQAASIFEEQLKEMQEKLKQTTNEKSDAIQELNKTKQANCILSNIIDQLKKEVDTALPASPRPSSRTVVKEDAGNISSNDTDNSETDMTIYQAWLESVRHNVVKHHLACTAATRDRESLQGQLREKDRATRLLCKQLSDLEIAKEEVESSLKMFEDKLASANARVITLEAKNKNLSQELGTMYTLAHVKKIEQLYKEKHEEKIKKLSEYHNRDAMKIDSLRERNQRLETTRIGELKENKERISQLKEVIEALKKKLLDKDRDIAFLLDELKTSKNAHVNKVVFSPQAERQLHRSASSTLSETSCSLPSRRPEAFSLGARSKSPRNFSPFKVDPSRIAELQKRNTKQPLHLKSTYAAETNFNDSHKYSEKDLKFGFRVAASDIKSLPTTANAEEVPQTLDLAQALSPKKTPNEDAVMTASMPNRLAWLSRTFATRRDGDSSSVTPLRARFNLQD